MLTIKMDWIIIGIISIILIIILCIILEFKYHYNLSEHLNFKIILISIILFIILIFIFYILNHNDRTIMLSKEQINTPLGIYDWIPSLLSLPGGKYISHRTRGIPKGLPEELLYYLIYLFDPKNAIIASKDVVAAAEKAALKNVDLRKMEGDVIELSSENEKTIPDIGVEKNNIRRRKEIYTLISGKSPEFNMFSLNDYYNISVENIIPVKDIPSGTIIPSGHNKIMKLTPKIRLDGSDIFNKYVMMASPQTNSFDISNEHEKIKDEPSYDFLCMLTKNAINAHSHGHYVVILVRKRNNEIKINLLDPLREEERPDLVDQIKNYFTDLFSSKGKYIVKYDNNYCGQQRKIDCSNCGIFGFKFIYNYLLLSYDNDNKNVIKTICPGRDASPLGALIDRVETVYKGPGNTVFDESEQYFHQGPTIPVKKFYFLTTIERNFIVNLIDIWKGKI